MISDNKFVLNQLDSNFALELAGDRIWGLTSKRLFGSNADIDIAAAEDIDNAGGTYTFSSAAEALYISSSNDADEQTVTVTGLDANYAEQAIDVVLDGYVKTRVGTTQTFLRVNSVEVDGATANTGDIYVYANDLTAQVDTVTVTGTGGTANIELAGGLTKLVTFDTDLTTTAANFVTAHAAAYLTEDIVVTSDADDIIFTALVAGTGFTSPTITNVSDDLAGSVANTTANNDGITNGVPDTATKVRAKVLAGAGVSQTTVYTVPANKTAFITSIDCSALNAATGNINIEAKRRLQGSMFHAIYSLSLKAAGDSSKKIDFTVPIALPEKTDFKITAASSADNAAVSANVQLILKDDR